MITNHHTSTSIFETRRGKPTPEKAARSIAIFAVIPSVIMGMFLGLAFVEAHHTFGRLVLVCAGFAVGSAALAMAFTLFVFRRFGFRPLVIAFDAMIGAYVGLMIGRILMVSGGIELTVIVTIAGVLIGIFVVPHPRIEVPPPEPPTNE